MDLKIKTSLLDIDRCIDEIFDFIGDNKEFSLYQKDLKTKKAVERNLEIIGKAVGRILKEDAHFILENAQNIIGTRNRIIHSYDNISDEIMWSIVVRDLPILKKQVSNYLQS